MACVSRSDVHIKYPWRDNLPQPYYGTLLYTNFSQLIVPVCGDLLHVDLKLLIGGGVPSRCVGGPNIDFHKGP